MLHRRDHEVFQSSTQELLDWGSTARQREAEAGKFAATLPMPLDDYRKQVDLATVDIDRLGACAMRYGVSLLAAILDETLQPEVTLFDLAARKPLLWEEQRGRVQVDQ
jgi:hypothetical protein